METNLHILTTGDHLLEPLQPGERGPSSMCVTYSGWGVSSVGRIEPGFHIAYMRVKDICARPIASAPIGTRLLLRPQHGIWVVGTITASTRNLFVEWAPLPKLPPRLSI
jgi:hypothetical protein